MGDHNNNKISLRNQQELQQIDQIRANFLEAVAREPDHFYAQDVQLVKSDEWWTLRYIKWNRGNVEKAQKQMINAFKWRKSFGLHDRNVNDIPREFAKAGGIFPFGFDHKNRPVLIIRVKVYRKIQQLNLFFQQFVTGLVNHVDQQGGRNGFVLVFDVTGLGLINFDMDFINFLIQLLQSYYPYGVRYTIVYNMPRVLRPLWTFTKLFLGGAEKTFCFCNTSSELMKYIPAHWLLRYMGGESDFDFTDFEQVRDAPSVYEIASRYNFSLEECCKLLKVFEDTIEDTQLMYRASIGQQ